MKIGNDFYFLVAESLGDTVSVRMNEYTKMIDGEVIYDLPNKKVWKDKDQVYGFCNSIHYEDESKGPYYSAGFYCPDNNIIYKFNEKEGYTVQKGSDLLVLLGSGKDSWALSIWKIYIYKCTEKDIKYITFSYNFYNKVNDMVADDISGKTDFTYRMVGPFEGKKMLYSGLEEISNREADRCEITSIDIEFMDGTSTTLSANDIASTGVNRRV